MRIRTNIFVWVFIATILPLTALALGAAYYSEYTHHQNVRQEIEHALNGLAGEMGRQMHEYERIAQGMAQSEAIRDALPLLSQLRRGEADSNINIQRTRLNRYFEGFQALLQGVFYVRVLDYTGNTLVKVSHDQRSVPIFESLSGVSYVEQEITDPGFVKLLRHLPQEEVSILRLPQNLVQAEFYATMPILDLVVPIYDEQRKFVGAVTLTVVGSGIDQIIQNAPRPYQGKLSVIEINPDDKLRHNLVLYDEANNLHFSDLRTESTYAYKVYGVEIGDYLAQAQAQQLPAAYSVELFPYSNRLINWYVMLQIDPEQVAAPFTHIRLAIWGCATLALVLTLVVANVGVRHIARPVINMAEQLRGYADGRQQVRLEERQPIDEVATLATAFNYMADHADENQRERDRAQKMILQSAKLASIGEMAAGIGHELNNPLNNILSYAKLLSRNLPDDDTQSRGDLASLREEALRATEIVKGILNFARQMPPTYSLFQLWPWLDNTLALVRQTALDRGVEIQTNKIDSITVEGDAAQLQQVLINLLLNAIQASPRGGVVSLHAGVEAEMLVITIKDQGPGVDESVMDKIFDPFFTTKGEGAGSGLGLSISLGILERHNGHLHIYNDSDGGVVAMMVFPLRRSVNAG